MSRLQLIIDISHDSVTVCHFDMRRFSPAVTESYSLMDFVDIQTALDHHFRQRSSFVYEACCIVCDAIYTDEWIIPAHNPQMRLSISRLKTYSHISKVFFLSPSEALSFSALATEAGLLQHLTGPNNITGNPLRFAVETTGRFSCSLFTGNLNSGRWYSGCIHCDEPQITINDAALTGYMHDHGNSVLLNERGLMLLYGYFCTGSDRRADCQTYSDVLSGTSGHDEPARRAAISTYFDLLGRFFLQIKQQTFADDQDAAFVVHTSRPDLFSVNFREYIAAAPDFNPVYSVYLNSSATPRLYGAAMKACC